MKRNNFILGLFLISFLALSACHKNDILSPENNDQNIPVVANVQNAFSFVVAARSYNHSDNYNLQFSGDTLAVAVTISRFINGSGEITIYNGNNSVIYSKKITSNIILADVMQPQTMPARINIDLNNFSGSLVLSAAAK